MTPLVLVHGFMGGQGQWHLQRDALTSGRTCVCIGLPGFADRHKEPACTTIAQLARSVVTDLDSLGIDDFDLLGHSMGGMIVQEMMRLARHRVRRLILYSTGAIGVLPGRFETIAQSKQRARDEGLEATARRIAGTWFLDHETADEYPYCAEIAAQTSQNAFDAGLDAMQNWSGKADLADITCPTLVLWGDGDRTYPWAQTQMLWQSIRGATLAVVPGCAHAVHLEKPAYFNQVIDDFLNGPYSSQ